MIIPDGHAGTQQVSAQDAAAVVQRGEFRLHVQAVRAANSTHSTGSQDRFRLCIIRPVLSAAIVVNDRYRFFIVSVSFMWIFLFAMKRDGRKGSANPSRPMESRRLTPPRLDRNRNAHPSTGIGGAFLVRKNAVSASQKQRGPSCGATRRKRPLCLVLRRAILLPRAAELSLPVCRLPSQAHAQWLTFVTQLSLFRCILALTVPFAVGFDPFPFRLPPDQTWPLQRAAARLHRTLFT